jgi:hypothetical protein
MKNLIWSLFLVLASPYAQANYLCSLSQEGKVAYQQLRVIGCEDAFCVLGINKTGLSFLDPQRAIRCDSSRRSCDFVGRWIDSSFFTINKGEPEEDLVFTLYHSRTGALLGRCAR